MAARMNILKYFRRLSQTARNYRSIGPSINEVPKFAGSGSKFVHELEFIDPEKLDRIPIYQVMNTHGEVLEQTQDPKLDKDTLLQMYKQMILLNKMDTCLNNAQKRGDVFFHMTNFGEEATQFGSAAALKPIDLIFGTYRDAGALMWRGFTLEQFMDQCHANKDDENKGKQMGAHVGCRTLNYVPYSSPIATQMPQAAGAAYAIKRSDKDRCVLSYFGEGSTSQGDAHAAFNFAATLNCPVIFFCRNNGYAISTTTNEQYMGDGIASKGPGYGMMSIRVDGNDVLAVYNVTQAARKICVEQNKPVLIEAITYRRGDHSATDDSSRYRDKTDVEYWFKYNNPVKRFLYYIQRAGYWDEQTDRQWEEEAQHLVDEAFTRSHSKLKPRPDILFDDVYANMEPHLDKQRKQLKAHVSKYKAKYPLRDYEHWDGL